MSALSVMLVDEDEESILIPVKNEESTLIPMKNEEIQWQSKTRAIETFTSDDSETESEDENIPPIETIKKSSSLFPLIWISAVWNIIFNCILRTDIRNCNVPSRSPVACDICGKTLSCPSSLRSRRGIHTGEMPFKCDICDRAFRYGVICSLDQIIFFYVCVCDPQEEKAI